jgi:hypothetical protein
LSDWCHERSLRLQIKIFMKRFARLKRT